MVLLHLECKVLLDEQADLLKQKREIEDQLLEVEWNIFRVKNQEDSLPSN